ncbi:MAG: glutamate--tRNA ligase, partial [candidate division Zixibacteria bacterium RBG_16_40_9]
MPEIRVRIAPSPSGYLHVGTARTAVYNWLFAQKHKGKFILRIEDTDVTRSSPEMVQGIIDALLWLGLKWDEGPLFQSQRMELYQKSAQKLLEDKRAYFCYCTPEELQAKREEAQKKKIAWKYDRKCYYLSEQEKNGLDQKGISRAIRLLVPEGKTFFHDIVYRNLEKENRNIEDLILLRSDGRPTYNLACVVDDLEMKISHVIRGNDHLPNTFKQVLIYQALGQTPPQFAHLPLILGMDRAKISKRFNAVSVTDYRDQGFLPEAVINFLSLLGWSPKDNQEILSITELIEKFSLENVHQANPVFDIQKLEWMNGEYIKAQTGEKLLELVKRFWIEAGLVKEEEFSQKNNWLLKIVGLLKERCKKLADFVDLGRFFFTSAYEFEEKAVEKQFKNPEAAQRLTKLAEKFKNLDGFDKEKSELLVRNLATDLNLKPAELIHPLRLAITGMNLKPAELIHPLRLAITG